MTKELLYQNKKIFCRSIGSGKPVILIHGFGEEGEVWGPPQTPRKEGPACTQPTLFENSSLIRKFKFIIPDLPGSGRSEMIDDMSMEGMAEVMKAILVREAPLPPEGIAPLNPPQGGTLDSDTSNKLYKFEDSENPPLEGREASPNPSKGGALDSDTIKQSYKFEDSKTPPSGGRGAGACIIGHSMGGYIALAFAEKYPEYLSALGLFHSSAYADSEEKKVTRRKGIEFIGQHGAFEFLKTSIPNLFSPQSKTEMSESIAEFIQQQHKFLPEALVSYYEAMMRRPDRTEMLRKSAVPVLFIMGKYDNAVPLADMLEQCHLPEKSYIHILRKSGHMGMLEEPEATNRILDEFLLEI